MLSEIEEIERTMKAATNTAVANVRIGMTPAEVIRVCGKPRSEQCDNFNYGGVWVIFEGYIVQGIIDARDYQPCVRLDYYVRSNKRIILK
jgi:hypothetical protein